MTQMRRYGKASLLLSMVIAMWLVAACGSSHTPLVPYDEAASRWEAVVDEHITDAQRADRLKQLGLQLDQLQVSLKQDVKVVSENLAALNVDYTATKNDMRQMVADFTAKRNAALKEYRDIIFSMRREVSEEEWQSLMK